MRRALFTAAIGLNALLLFLVQPLAARLLLPIFGGAPAVWNVALLFFQTLLIAGYAWAHAGPEKLGRRGHGLLHLSFLVLGAGAAFLLRSPILELARKEAAISSAPLPLLLFALLFLVGLPYGMLAAGSPLVQRWFAATDDRRAADPYFLYAASNVGSLLGLVLYPFLLEPIFPLRTQWNLWLGGILLVVVLFALCLARTPDGGDEGSRFDRSAARSPIARRTAARWLVLAAVPSALVMATTSYVTSNVAPVPLLWIVPLSLYLLSFVLAFAGRPLLCAKTVGRAFAIVATPLLLALALEASTPIGLLAGLHLLAMFLGAWTLHARLAESRPPAAELTRFYLTLSVGGALGGFFVAIVAPLVFATSAEYPLAVVLALALRPPLKPESGWRGALVAGAVGLVVAGVGVLVARGMPPTPLRTGVAFGVPLVLAFALYDRPRRMAALAGAALLVVGLAGLSASGRVLLTRRSFFGVNRVVQEGRLRTLFSGVTVHGRQDARAPRTPLTYYHPTGPIGRVMRSPFGRGLRRAGFVGLGVGSLAAYSAPGQSFRFFEIDPSVIAIARDPSLFTFLSDARGRVEIVAGDGRLSLSREAPASFDLVVLDAFSSDAIPTHLLTREGLGIAMGRVRPGGLLAIHVSNRYLRLAPIVAATARSLGLLAYESLDGVSDDEREAGKTPSDWMLLARSPADLSALGEAKSDWSPESGTAARAWTDDRADVLGALALDE